MTSQSPQHVSEVSNCSGTFEVKRTGAASLHGQSAALPLLQDPSRYFGSPEFVRKLLENIQDGVVIFRDGKQIFSTTDCAKSSVILGRSSRPSTLLNSCSS